MGTSAVSHKTLSPVKPPRSSSIDQGPVSQPEGIRKVSLRQADEPHVLISFSMATLLALVLGLALWCAYVDPRLQSERRQRGTEEQHHGRLAQKLAALESVLPLLVRTTSLTEALGSLTTAMENTASGRHCSILLLNRSDGKLRLGSGGSLPQEYVQAIDGMETGPESSPCGVAVFLNETVAAKDIVTDGRWIACKDLALTHNLRSCWSIPVRDSNGEILGALAFYHHQPLVLAAEDLQLLNAGAALASLVIERIHNGPAVQRAVQRPVQMTANGQCRAEAAEVGTMRALGEQNESLTVM